MIDEPAMLRSSIAAEPQRDRGFESPLLRQGVCLTGCHLWLSAQGPGLRRECEPGRDQRTGRAGHKPARLGRFSLTGTMQYPLEDHSAQREKPRPRPGLTLSGVALQLASSLR